MCIVSPPIKWYELNSMLYVLGVPKKLENFTVICYNNGILQIIL